MAKPTKPTLSEHLLEEALRLLYYPQTLYRNETNLAVQEELDEEWQELLDWRQTLVPSGREGDASWLFARPRLIDQLYSRQLLGSVGEMVQRTLNLAQRSFAGIGLGESLVC